MNIENFDHGTIENLSFCASFCEIAFGADLDDPDERTSRLRKKITRRHLKLCESLTPETKQALKECGDEEFFDIILACRARIRQEHEDELAEFSAQYPEFSERTELAQMLFDFGDTFSGSAVQRGDDICLFCDRDYNIVQLTLKNATVLFGKSHLFSEEIATVKLERDDSGYTLKIETCNWDEAEVDGADVTAPKVDSAVHCSEILVAVKAYRREPAEHANLWDYLEYSCAGLVEREKFGELSDEEKAILPTAVEIFTLFSDGGASGSTFPIIKEAAVSLGYGEVCKKLKLSKNPNRVCAE